MPKVRAQAYRYNVSGPEIAHRRNVGRIKHEFIASSNKKYAKIAAAVNAAAAADAATAASLASAAAAAPPFTQNECVLCARIFSESECSPRLLAYGHTFCTACIGAHVVRTSRRTWHYTCVVDREKTSVVLGNAATLVLNSSFASAQAPLFRIHLKNLAGDTVTMLIVSATWTVGSVKRALCDVDDMYVVYRQRLMLHGADDEYTVLDDDEAMLGALGIGRERCLTVVMHDPYSGGEYVRTICCSDEKLDEWRHPGVVCVSPCGHFVFLCELNNHYVSVLRMADGASERIIHFVSHSSANDLCLSRDGALLFVATQCNVLVHRVLDGTLVRTIGTEGIGDDQFYGHVGRMCLSADDEYLFVIEGQNRIQVMRVSNSSHVRTIALAFRPKSMCLSSDGQLLFVVHARSEIDAPVHVVRVKDGAHIRTLGLSGFDIGSVQIATDVSLSRNGELLFVSDSLAQCVHVLRASDGAYVRSIGAGSKGARADECRFSSLGRIYARGEQLLIVDGGSCFSRVQVFTV